MDVRKTTVLILSTGLAFLGAAANAALDSSSSPSLDYLYDYTSEPAQGSELVTLMSNGQTTILAEVANVPLLTPPDVNSIAADGPVGEISVAAEAPLIPEPLPAMLAHNQAPKGSSPLVKAVICSLVVLSGLGAVVIVVAARKRYQ